MPRPRVPLVPFAVLGLGCATLAGGPAWFTLRVVDPAGHGIGCVRLVTPMQTVYETDAQGLARFWEPGLMGRRVFFTPVREGFEHPRDAAGIAGRAFEVEPGASGTLRLEPVGPAPACDAARASDATGGPAGRDELFRIDVVDAASRRGVPRIELRAPRGASWLTDSRGVVAFDDPSRFGRETRFAVNGDGYRLPDPEGGVVLVPRGGARAEIALERIDVAERLYRVTGTGIYRESVRLGLEVPIRHPLVNADVAGQDSVEAVLYRGRVFWIWGDTPSIAHPLWNYHATGATSRLPADGGLDPARGVDLDYFVDRRGRVRALAKVPGEGATWLSGLVNLPDARGEETLLAFYGKHVEVAPPRERGLARYDPQTQRFVSARVLETPLPIGSALRVRGAQGDFVHYGDAVRIPAQAESFLDPSRWQAFTPFARPGSKAERDAQGFVRWAWRTNVPPADAASLREGGIAPDETLSDHVTDVASGARVASRPDSTASNAHRGRYVRIFTQLEGLPSRLGEVWYVEGDTPMGPWVFARKIVSHRNYGFYNPRQHPFFDQRGGRTLYFEGTYSAAFGEGAVPTPREDYNQVMHRLDLDDPRLFLPVPIYDLGAGGRPERFVDKRGLRPADGDPPIAFFAHDRPLPGSLAVWWSGAACGERRLVAGSAPATAPLFFALAAPLPAPRTQALPVLAPEGEPAHAAYAYANPLRVRLPVSAHLPELIADAGPDRCLREGRAGGGARLVLDAAGSSGPDGVPLRYEWSWPGGVASGSRAEARLPAGLNDVRLRVSTPDGVSAHDALVVEVAPAQVRAGSGSALAARSTLRTSSRLRPARPPGPTWRLPPTSSIASRP